jgi:hypothetical protein
MVQEKEKRSIMPGPMPPMPPPNYNEMHQMGLRLVEMGLELLRNGQIYPCDPPYQPFDAKDNLEKA